MKVLLAEHDADTLAYLAAGLRCFGHDIRSVSTGSTALYHGMDGSFDTIVIDTILPEGDGAAVIRALRVAKVDTPILVLTGGAGGRDWTEACDAGADDYLAAPFPLGELAARLGAITARRPAAGERLLGYADIAIDLNVRSVQRGATTVNLCPYEFAVLVELVRARGLPVTSAMLLERVWGFHFTPGTDIVKTHLSRLRGKLNAGFAHDAIQTLQGVGYRIVADA